MREKRVRTSPNSGQSLVEFAIVLPILLALVVGIFEFGVAWNRKQVLTNAAREGARLAVLPNTISADTVNAVINNYLTSAGISAASVTRNISGICSSSCTGSTVTIQLQMNHTLPFVSAITGFLSGSPTAGAVTLNSVVNMRHE